MAILNLFKSKIPSVNYIFRNGKAAPFINGRFTTDIEEEIAELKDEIAKKHPHIYIDAAEVTIDSEKQDPIAGLRESIIAQYLAEQAAATNPDNDMGETVQGKLNVQTSTDIAQAASGGSGAAITARLANLTITK